MAAIAVDESQNWFCVNLAGDICLREALLEILHDPNNQNFLPKDGKQLYQRMITFKHRFANDLRHVIRPDQWMKICPPSGESNSDDWDITKIKVVIQYENVLPPPTGGWENRSTPQQNDRSKSAYVCHAKNIRNELKHATFQELTDVNKFNDLMQKIEDALNGLGYNKMNIFQDLKTCHMEAYTKQTVKLVKDSIFQIQHEINELKRNKGDVVACKLMVAQLKKALMKMLKSQANDTDTEGEIIKVLARISKQQQEIESIDKRLKLLHENQHDLRECQEGLEKRMINLEISGQKNIKAGDVEIAIATYRRNILEQYSQQTLCDPIQEAAQNKYIIKNREQVFVDLAIIDQHQIYTHKNEKVNDPECYQYLAQQLMVRKQISIKELVQDNKYVLIEGIAGIGKTELMDTLILKWAKMEILNGKDRMPNIDLLLPIKCRELNTRNISSSDTNESILKKLFPVLFEKICLKDLEVNGYNVMFLIDGLDELMSVEQIEQPNKVENPYQNKILHFIRDTMASPNCLPSNQYICVAGRPTVINVIDKILTKPRCHSSNIRRVQVCGFNKQSIEEYVRKHCDNIELQIKVTEEIKSSEYLTAMARIPVYLWVICNIYKDNLHITAPRTTTELMVYACLVFIRNHLLDSNNEIKELSLQEICERKDVISLILSVAEISFLSLNEGKVIFENQEIQQLNCDVDGLERKLGFIIKTRNGESGCFYQFTHLVLQEFFAAIYIFLSNDFLPILTKKSYGYHESLSRCISFTKLSFFKKLEKSSLLDFLQKDNGADHFIENIGVCYPIICGLEGLAMQPNKLLNLFVEKLKDGNENEDDKEISLMQQAHNLILTENYNIQLSEYKDYLRCVFENGCDLPQNVVDKLMAYRVVVNLSLTVSVEYKTVVHFLQKLSMHKKVLSESLDKIYSIMNNIKSIGLNCVNERFNIIIDSESCRYRFEVNDSFNLKDKLDEKNKEEFNDLGRHSLSEAIMSVNYDYHSNLLFEDNYYNDDDDDDDDFGHYNDYGYDS